MTALAAARPDDAPRALGDAQIAPTAALLADPARAAMLWALSDGRALPAGVLAQVARVGAPTASAHLAKLTTGGLLDGCVYTVTDGGRTRFAELGIDVHTVAEAARRTRRPLTRACLDWSERRYHLAGALGAALVDRLLDAGWVERMPTSRALRVTNAGRRALRRKFDVQLV
jgi:DNA-binding transcriptional ArsR family regulator